MDKYKTPIEGLIIIPNFITKEEEEYLIQEIEDNEWNTSLKRLTQHYGYMYDYKSRTITNENYIGELPEYFNKCDQVKIFLIKKSLLCILL